MIQRLPKKNELPLEAGDCVSWPEFERRAALTPERKLELIDGVVYVGPPVGFEHSNPHFVLNTWLGAYSFATPGTEGATDGTVVLDMKNAPQPDLGLMVLPDAGGRSRFDDAGYVTGGIELVLEVSRTTTSKDLHNKKDAYYKHACLEYVVYVTHTKELLWFVHEDEGYAPLAPSRGVLKSRVFPGLWLDAKALVENDRTKLMAVLRKGLATRAHATFAAELRKRLRGVK